MSVGWAWQCDDCGNTEIIDAAVAVGRFREQPPPYWAVSERWLGDDGSTRRRVYCVACSDGRNL